MKTTLALSAFVASALAQSQAFSSMALRSASPIHFAQINAAGQKFWLAGQPTESYCPNDPATCPAGTSTVFVGGDTTDTLSLSVEVPGGQQVYIAPDGTMSYTQAHSANIPPGSILDGWSRDESGAGYGHLYWQGGLVGCPVEGKGYQIYGLLPGLTYDDCLGFTAVTNNQTEIGAWEYT